MFIYDRRSYNGTFKDLLQTVNDIENFKWTFINYASKIPLNSSAVPTTDLTIFSNPKHVQADETDDSFIRSAFNFLVFMVPQTMVFVYVLKKAFCSIA